MTVAAASTNIGLWQFQSEDKPIWATNHCRFILGLAEESPLSFDVLRKSVYPDDRPSLVKAIREAASNGRPIDVEFRVPLIGGENSLDCNERLSAPHGL